MAPEQLEGRAVDGRSDPFALGALVHEMATGRKAFEATSQTSLVAAILSAEPTAISALQPLSPPALDRVVKKRLTKDPDERWQSARDLADALKWISQDSSQVASSRVRATALVSPNRRNRRLIVAALCVSVAAAVAAGLWLWGRPAEPLQATNLRLISTFSGSIGEPAFRRTATSSRFSTKSTASRKCGSRTWQKVIRSK